MSVARVEQVRLPYLHQPAHWAMLESGHQVLVIPKPGDVLHLHTVVRAGSVNETEESAGISHFLEHLMFKGTERLPAGEFDRILEGIGARVNAGTGRDYTQYFVTLPRDPAGAHFRLALDLHADMLLHAALPEEEIGPPFDPERPEVTEKRERMVVLEEIKLSMDIPWRRAVKAFSELIYPTHPYRREVIGSAEVIATVSAEAIRSYCRHWYRPEHMITLVAGEVDADAAIREVAEHFRCPRESGVEHPAFPPERPPEEPQITRLTAPLNVGYVVLGFLGPPSADLRGAVALDTISLILGEGKSSRLRLTLVERLPNTPFISTGSNHVVMRDSSNVLCYGVIQPTRHEEAFELLRREVERLHSEPPTDAELAKAVTRLEAQFAAGAETAAELSFAVADSMAQVSSPANYTEYLPILRSLTPEELARYIARYLDPRRLCGVIVSSEQPAG